ncbi:hypothetical protein CYLTODRAFT_162397 [Cylindrobasidium torrendii FP15055 ss-10]|uniref:DUF6535 domain-containing protein n=1 Tax=Cylindrobasidium torrendii FP15055 ss-10 TaxID=1314674 RepID=A0A0D7AXB3_9AGAR|nr:hypothetical protein CYLTODRAFT_162397 [Cylindrobasidium torrendii FP15055 ss-10]
MCIAFDYTKKYPRDKRYEELHDDARVWRTYNDEAAIFDTDMVGEAADSLDILLVFAGLFSAILSTFVAQTSQSLSPDSAALTVSLLAELVAVQRAALTGAPLSDIASVNLSPAIKRTSIWVNALWFTGLALSLASALLAVLSKQWLRQYVSFIAGSARERALIRQFRYDGMEKWAVRTIVGLLPTILHLALGLFLAGLVVFLAPLQRGIAISVGIISGTLFAAYISSIIIAVVHVQSPYRTTFSDIISTSLRWLFNTVYPIDPGMSKGPLAPTARAAEQTSAVCLEERTGATQACNALMWLHTATGSMSAKNIIMYSLGAFPDQFFDGDKQQGIFARLGNGYGPDIDSSLRWVYDSPNPTVYDWERKFRILCHSKSVEGFLDMDVVVDHLESDVGLALACAAVQVAWPDHRRSKVLPKYGRSAQLAALQGLFSKDACLILTHLRLNIPDIRMPSVYVAIAQALGSAPPVVWSSLARNSPSLNCLSPRDLDNWPSHINLRAYLHLIVWSLTHSRSPSVFQTPVDFLTVLHSVFQKRGWYHRHDESWHHKSLQPLFGQWTFVPQDNGDNDLIVDSPPPNENAVWEPAVYPSEWPPLPAPTWAAAWDAAEAEYKSEDTQENAKDRGRLHFTKGGLGNGIRKLVREKLCGGNMLGDETRIETV